MIERIVKLTFKPEFVAEFVKVFDDSKSSIASFPGCKGLKLLNDRWDTNVFFTYSKWDSEEDLNRYRESELFNTTWERTKVLFAAKPAAWSVNIIETVK